MTLESPLAAAISEHRAAEGELPEVLPDGALRTYWVKAVPFFTPADTSGPRLT